MKKGTPKHQDARSLRDGVVFLNFLSASSETMPNFATIAFEQLTLVLFHARTVCHAVCRHIGMRIGRSVF